MTELVGVKVGVGDGDTSTIVYTVPRLEPSHSLPLPLTAMGDVT